LSFEIKYAIGKVYHALGSPLKSVLNKVLLQSKVTDIFFLQLEKKLFPYILGS